MLTLTHELLIIRPVLTGEIPVLQQIDKSARSRYLDFPSLAAAAHGAPIATDRFSNASTIVAELDQHPVGFVLSQPLDGMLYLANISVSPEARGQQFGLKLLEATIELARQANLPALALATFKTPPWNGPWFRKQGFVSMAKEDIGPGLQAILDRHATFLDMTTRETLWKKLD